MPVNGPNDLGDWGSEIPGKTPGAPAPPDSLQVEETGSTVPWWRRLIGSALHTWGSRIKPPANFGFPSAPEHDDSEPGQETLSVPRGHPVAFGFLFTVGVGLALLGFFLLTNVGSLVIWIAIALFIALGLDPVVRFFVGKGLSRRAGVLITMALLLGVAGGFIGIIIPTLVTQTAQFIERAPGIIDDFMKSEFFVSLDRQYQVSDRISQDIGKFFSDTGTLGGIFGGVLGVGSIVAQSLIGTLIVLVLTIYFLAGLPSFMTFCYRLAPRSKRERARDLGTTITRSVGNYVIGQAVVAVLNATVALILMSILQVPFAALLTLMVAILAFIPLVGGMIAGILVSLLSLTLGSQTAAIYAICYFGYLQLEAYFISPRIMQKAVAVPGAVAVISVIAGGTLLGVPGALMAIPTAAGAMLLLREVFIQRQDRR